jgi:hypothetical protein
MRHVRASQLRDRGVSRIRPPRQRGYQSGLVAKITDRRSLFKTTLPDFASFTLPVRYAHFRNRATTKLKDLLGFLHYDELRKSER